ncbi:hypothetical protein B0H12DRAFT_1244604 [Mycena haematopus]|nr:hypothetical protein B0H12DRAFT_1244604 [Mycena haematopus]
MSQPSTPSPSTPSLHLGRRSVAVTSGVSVARKFPPMFNNMPEFTAADPHEHRKTHDFRYPCCLCSVHELDPEHFTEAAVFMVRSRTLSGIYVAACARGLCKYWAFSVLIERMYPKRLQPVREYPLRDLTTTAPPELLQDGLEDGPSSVVSTPFGSAAGGSSPLNTNPLRRTRSDVSDYSTVFPPTRRRCLSQSMSIATAATAGSSSPGPVNPFIIPYATPEPLPVPTSPFAMLMQLDASSNPGLTEAQFRKLFVRCSACRLFTTSSAFEDHNCHPLTTLSTEVIDLTGDD